MQIKRVIYLQFLIFLFFQPSNFAQLLLQDDFQFKSNHWYWRADGNQSIPLVDHGLLKLRLENAVESEYCNTEIYNPTEPYGPGSQVRVRLKTSSIHNGSRGWGFWDGDFFLPALLLEFDVAWVMQQGSHIDEPAFRWFFFGVASDTLTSRQTFNLDSLVDETEWHTYKIVWDIDKVQFFIDDQFIYETTDQLPDQKMRMDIWIDNRVINDNNPIVSWNNDVEESEMLVDFVEISSSKGPQINRIPDDNMILWESPNSFPNGEKNYLWKDWDFELNSSGEVLFFLTGRAETYRTESEDDDLKIVLNGEDFGWDSDLSFDGDAYEGDARSIQFVKELDSGTNNLKLFSDITPFLRDVIILHSREGRTLFNDEFNETIESEGLWKSIDFTLQNKTNVTFIVSGTAKKRESLWMEVEGENFPWKSYETLIGDSLPGIPKTLVASEILDTGSYSLKIYGHGTPKLLAVAAYGTPLIASSISNDHIPNEVSLKASPNPFNPETNIHYSIPSSTNIKLSIVNVLGEEIETILNETKSPGNYVVKWNGSSETSGIYFCILETDNYFKVNKLLLLK